MTTSRTDSASHARVPPSSARAARPARGHEGLRKNGNHDIHENHESKILLFRAFRASRGEDDESDDGATMKITTFDEFKDLAQRGTFVPVCKEMVADLLTPVSAFL